MSPSLPKIILLITFAATGIGLTGCATSPVKAARKAGISTVTVEPHVNLRSRMRYGVPGGPGLGAVLTGAIRDNMKADAIAQMGLLMHTNGIDVGKIVHDRFVAALQRQGAFAFTESNPDATFFITVLEYGFDNPGLKFSTKGPFLMLQAELVSKAGKKIWHGLTTVRDNDTDGIGSDWNGYTQRPDKLRRDWEAQADNVIAALLRLDKTQKDVKSVP